MLCSQLDQAVTSIGRLDWSLQHGCPTSSICAAAAAAGTLDVLAHARSLRLPWGDVCTAAARAGQLDALKYAGIPYQIAYLSNVSESQLAAVRADLAVAALPFSRIRNASQPICINDELPKLPYTQIVLRTAVNPSENTKALAAQVLSAFNRPE